MGAYISFGLLVACYLYMARRKSHISKGQVVDDVLTFGEKVFIWIICIVDPLFGGFIFYYGWKKALPQMAKEANRISMYAFGIEVVLGILYFLSKYGDLNHFIY
jgi:TRAP-type C4-dicarboxylate transport system permease small subunit